MEQSWKCSTCGVGAIAKTTRDDEVLKVDGNRVILGPMMAQHEKASPHCADMDFETGDLKRGS